MCFKCLSKIISFADLKKQFFQNHESLRNYEVLAPPRRKKSKKEEYHVENKIKVSKLKVKSELAEYSDNSDPFEGSSSPTPPATSLRKPIKYMKRRNYPVCSDSTRKRPEIRPQDEVRIDQFGHFGEYNLTAHQIRCKNPGCSYKTNIICCKCRVSLCLNLKRNCFKEYHFLGEEVKPEDPYSEDKETMGNSEKIQI